MSALGRLVASVILDTAEFTVGTDKAKYLAAQAAGSIDRSFKDVGRSVTSTLTGIGSALAAGFTVVALKNTYDEFVKFRGELQKVHVTTSASVESLSVLGQAAKLAGSDIGTLEAAMIKMTKGLSASNADTKDTGRALEYLGVAGRDAIGNLRDPGDVMRDIAKKMGDMHDGANKTAIALALWGKSGAQMLPIMKEMFENGDLIAKVTAKQAYEAHEYEKAITRLGIATSAAGKIVMNELVVPLTSLIEVLTKSISGTDGLSYSLKGLAKSGELTTWGENVGYALATVIDLARLTKDAVLAIGSSFTSVGADAMLATTKMLGPLGMLATGLATTWRNAQAEEAGRRWGVLLESNTTKTRDAYLAQLDLNKSLAAAFAGAYGDQASRAAGRATAAPFKGTDHAATATKESLYRTENAQLEIQIQKLKGIGELEQYITKLGENKYAKLTPQEKAALIAKEELLLALKREHELSAALAKDHEEDLKWVEKKNEAIGNLISGMEDSNERLAFENTLIGKTAQERELANLAFEKELMLRGELTPMQRASIENLANEKAGLIAARQAMESSAHTLEQQARTWGELADKAGAFFGDLIVNGKSAFDRLKQEMKSFAQDLIALFAKRWILNMVAGGSVIGAAGDALAGAGAGGAVGQGSMAASLFTTAADVYAGYTGAAATTAWTSGALAAEGYAGATAAGTTMATSFGTALSAIPVWGWIAAAVLAVAFYFSGKGGGPKVGGYSGSSFDAAGNLTGSVAAPGIDNGRYFTPTQMDAQLKEVTDGFGKVVTNTLKRFGATGGQGLSFLLGVDNDPQGSARSRVSAGVLDASGHSLYSNRDQEMDDKEVPAAVALEFSRGVLVALQNSDLPAYLKKAFEGLNAMTVTQQQIDDAFSMADALKTIFDVVSRNPMEDVATAIEASQNQFSTAMKNNETAIRAVMAAFDGSLKSTQNLSAATVAYYNAQMSLLVSITAVSQAVKSMFDTTFQNIALAGMDKQGKYNFYQRDAEEARALALASSDPEMIRTYATRINNDINAAFALLSPEEQAAQSGAFLTQGREAQQQIEDRLTKIQKDAAAETKKTLDDIAKLIGASADKEAKTAERNFEASTNNLTASTTPLAITINGDQTTSVNQ